MPQLYDDLSDDSVFERTPLGCMSTFKRPQDLLPQEHRLLLMVTGYTPIKDLMALLDQAEPITLASRLLERGLIQPVMDTAASYKTGWPFGKHRSRDDAPKDFTP